MATRKKKAALYEPSTNYEVVLKKPVSIMGLKFLPRDEHEMIGSLLNAIVEQDGSEVIDAAQPK